MSTVPMTDWLMRTLLSGGVLLLLAWVALRFLRGAALRQQLAAWTFRGAVLSAVLAFLPAWLIVRVPQEQPAPITVSESPPTPQILASPIETSTAAEPEEPQEWIYSAAPVEVESVPVTPLPKAADKSVVPSVTHWQTWLLSAYMVIAGLAALQLVIAFIALIRLKGSAVPAPGSIQAIAAELDSFGVAPRIMLSGRVTTPVCFGVRSPVVLLPMAMADAPDDELRWVLAHEFNHLHRGDPRTGLWVGLARVLYFALPWFWSVRRELRLAQEYLADAAAAAGRPADYAAFLVSLSASPARTAPLGAMAVRAGSTDLFRRVSMLTQGSAGGRSSRFGSLLIAGTVLASAVSLSGLGLAGDQPAKAPPQVVELELVIDADDTAPKKEGKKDGDKKAETRRVEVIVGGEEIAKLSKAVSEALEKGDVAAAKEAMAKLNKALAAQPKVMRVEGGFMPAMPAFPAPPAPPAPPGVPGVPSAAPFVFERVKVDVKALEEKLAALTKALESVKDSPEAREALEKTISEFKKKIEEARRAAVVTEGEIKRKVDAEIAAQRDKFQAMIHKLEDAIKSETDPAKLEKFKAEKEKLAAELAALTAKRAMEWRARPADGATFAFGKGGGVAVAAGQPRLGITLDSVSETLADQLDLPKNTGVIITSVFDGSVAAKAGIKPNDILISIAGKPVPADPNELAKTVSGLKADEKFDIVVIRKGKKETIKDVVLPAPKKRSGSDNDKADGMKFKSMNVNVNDGEFTIKASNDGLSITITGTLVDGKPVARSVSGTRDGVDFSVTDVSKLSKSDQSIVEQLLKNVSGSSK